MTAALASRSFRLSRHWRQVIASTPRLTVLEMRREYREYFAVSRFSRCHRHGAGWGDNIPIRSELRSLRASRSFRPPSGGALFACHTKHNELGVHLCLTPLTSIIGSCVVSFPLMKSRPVRDSEVFSLSHTAELKAHNSTPGVIPSESSL
jgi:hypothetical protein